jgi:hypothetical protein
MKLFLTALCASFMVVPMAFADEDCGKCKKGGEKKEEGTVFGADCGKCDKDGAKKKEEGTLLAHCGKCEGDKDHKKGEKKEEKKEGTVV